MSLTSQRTRTLTLSAILTAFAILIPLLLPKVVIGPASYTLASHLPIFLAMFISPRVALAVALGSALGFQLASFPPVIVARAASHVIFALVGALWLKKSPKLLDRLPQSLSFSFAINALHAFCEVAAVYLLTVSGGTGEAFWYTLVVLIGIGTLVHGMVDFYLAAYVWRVLPKR